MISGASAVEGITIGKVYIKQEVEIEVVRHKIEDIDGELERFKEAAEACRIELEIHYNKALNILGEEEAGVYKRHMNVFDGSILLGQVRKEVQEQRINAEYVLNEVKKKYANMFDRVADEFLKAKSESIKYIAEQLLKQLMDYRISDVEHIDSPVIVVAKKLDNSDIINFDKKVVLGIVTELGGKTSYSALIARKFNVPAVVGVSNILSQIEDGDELIIDGYTGEIFINPDEKQKEYYIKKGNKNKALEDIYSSYTKRKTVTDDHHEFEIAAFTENIKDIELAKKNGAESIGLFKTEFLFLGREDMPDESVQVKAYTKAINMVDGYDVIFRTLDCTADNNLPYIYFHDNNNPAIGYRSIRVTLEERQLFIIQLRAILRTSAYGHVKIVFPMISSIEELLEAKLAVEEAKISLDEQKIFYDTNIQIGIMVEVPATAMLTNIFAREVDFLIIGTNNLMQFMLAVDRGNEAISDLYNIYHPGVLRIIKSIVLEAHKEGTWVGLAGDMANSELLIPFFTALGIDQLCMKATLIAKARWLVSKMNKGVWEAEVSKIMEMESASEIKSYIEKRCYEDFGGV